MLILTPVKQAERHLDRYWELLSRLEHPRDRLSLGMLESDSTDDTFSRLQSRLPTLRSEFARVTLVQRHFGFTLPPGLPRWSVPFQLARRSVLARSRNHLLFAALRDEDWVLWMDVDLEDFPADIIGQLLAAGKDIVLPHCVTQPGGPTFDLNAWRDQGRTHMDALRGRSGPVRLDAVGGAMLLVRADVHRSGLIFPPYRYGRESRFARNPGPHGGGIGEVETEGLGMMAKDMAIECWGLPDLEIMHKNE